MGLTGVLRHSYVSILQQHELWSAVTTQVAIIVAPAFMAAYIYMLVGRMMSYLGSEYSPISHNIITKVCCFPHSNERNASS